MRPWKWIAAVAVVGAAVVAAWAAGLFGPRHPGQPGGPEPAAPGVVRFEDVAARAGIKFRHFDPATPLHLISETMGTGVAWIDYDADGWPDLFCVQAGPLPGSAAADAPIHRLYRNNRDGTFTDVTAQVGLDRAGFGTGVAVGDFDNDGFDDLAITYMGRVELWHNEPAPGGGRRFVDVTEKARLAGTDPHYATSCAWGDLDGDGFLDLYVCNYVEMDPAHPLTCKNEDKGVYHGCSPTAYPRTAHRLYRNNGDGTFADVTAAAGVAAARPAPGLAVVIVDVDGDGRPDVYVANDQAPAYLFHNQTPKGGPIKLVERAELSGCGLGPGGGWMSGMAAETAEVDGSGRPSLFVTNFQNEPNVLFYNRGNLRFAEASMPSGLGGPSRSKLGFGSVFFDADLDGNLDVAVANGHVQRMARELFGAPYAQNAQLFLGDGAGKFRDVTDAAGSDFVRPRVGRGLARCDFDNDGRPDLALSGVGEPVALLRNVTDTPNDWVSLELIGDGKASNRNAIGAVARVEGGGKVRTRFVTGGGSYLSASDRRLALGLGPGAAKLDKVTVTWPSGRTQEFRDLAAGAFWRLHEGRAEPERFKP